LVFVHPNSDKKLDARQLAQQLRLDAVLRSSLEPCDKALCICAQLVHARSPGVIWSTRDRIPEAHATAQFPNLIREVRTALVARVPGGAGR
jgi:TolB-like protein